MASAIQFLLISPAFVRRPFTPAELGRSAAFFPLVGLILGGLLTGMDMLLGTVFTVQVRSALVLGLWIVLTGALHFDGLLDTCDGFFGGGTPQRRMEIMRDERTGAYAAAAGIILLLTMFSALSAIHSYRWAALLLAPLLGRCGLTLSVVAFPYARATGLGRDIKDHAHGVHAASALLITIAAVGIVLWQTHSPAAAVAVASSAIVWWLAARFILSRLPGMTGDTYGAMCMLVETSALLALAASL